MNTQEITIEQKLQIMQLAVTVGSQGCITPNLSKTLEAYNAMLELVVLTPAKSR